MSERSRDKLLEFMDYLSEKGLVATATISARKASANKVLGILKGPEADDVTKLDLNEVMRRFQNLEGKGYTPASLKSYLSRTKSAIDDFKNYLENPLAFRPGVQARERRKPEAKSAVERSSTEPSPHPDKQPVKAPLSSSLLPIQIRSDTTVFVQGLPYDLTDAEASKIANVIKAHVMPA